MSKRTDSKRSDAPQTDSHDEGRSVIVAEFEFTPTLIGRFRRWVHRLAGEWAIRYLIQQQNEINLQQNQMDLLLKESLQSVDQDLVETHKQLAQLTTLVAQQQKKIESLESKLLGQSGLEE